LVAYAKTRCGRCGWRYPSFHICLDLPLEVMRRVEDVAQPKRQRARAHKRDPRSDAYRGTDEWRSNISAGLQEYHNQRRAANRERDREIVKRYSEDQRTVRELATEFGISFQTILSVLHTAQDDGVLVIRPAARRIRS
jgi:predicted Rossmann fold nucleotide-binding protein DprA/Smf involved in DNA uptake